jgi:hypothetical protein
VRDLVEPRVLRKGEAEEPSWNIVDRLPFAAADLDEFEGEAWVFSDGVVTTPELLPVGVAALSDDFRVIDGGVFGYVLGDEFVLRSPTPFRL